MKSRDEPGKQSPRHAFLPVNLRHSIGCKANWDDIDADAASMNKKLTGLPVAVYIICNRVLK